MADTRRTLLSYSVSRDWERQRLLSTLRQFQGVGIAGAALWALVCLAVGDREADLAAVLAGLALVLGSVALQRAGRLRGSARALVLAYWGLSTYAAVAGGAIGVGGLSYLIALVLADRALGRGAVMIAGAAAAAILLAVFGGSLIGVLAYPPVDLFSHIGGHLMLTAACVALMVTSSADRRRAIRELQSSELRYAGLAVSSPDGLIVLSNRRVITLVNPALLDMVERGVEGLLGRPLAESGLLGGEALALVERRIQARIGGELRGPFELELCTGAGGCRPVEVSLGLTPEDERAFIQLNLRDISARREAERERRRAEVRAREAVKIECVMRLAGGVAHDFNNLLQTIQTSAELLSDAPRTASEREDLEMIREAAARGADLSRKLSVFSGRQALSPERVDLNALIRELRAPIGRLLGDAIELVLVYGSSPIPVEVDVGQLKQSLINLVLNAREAMPEGGRLRLEIGRVHLEDPRGPGPGPGDYARLVVEDSGRGIPDEALDKLFEPFYTTRRGASGLGLSTAHGTVVQSGGSIRAESPPGGGARFEILLPLAGPAASLGDSPGGGSVILLVEDRSDVRRGTRLLLEAAGYEVLEAGDAAAARRIWLVSGGVDCLLSDVTMPGEDGVSLAIGLRQQGFRGPVILMSGFADGALMDAAALAGARFVPKPFTRDALLSAVAAALSEPGGALRQA